MRAILTAIILLLGGNALATWSIIIVDPGTGEIGIAGASCTKNCYGIGEIIPGKGAIIVQAMSNSRARSKGVQMILTDHSPDEIIAALMDSYFDPERQQYAVVTLKHFKTPMTYTGDSTRVYKGAFTTNGISVQGNTLTNETVLEKILHVVQKAKDHNFPIDEILMLALEAGSQAGGDVRCGEQRATSAFITVAKTTHKKPYLNLMIFNQVKGGPNAVSMLRKKYDRWKSKRS
jgi:uncharacterized Ntn-hydrolase superfamily protein